MPPSTPPPPLLEPKDDLELKQEELEQMRLTDRDLGTKVAYQGQELHSHVAFTNQAAHLANEIGDTNGFLLPAIRSQLPEAVKNMLKSLGKKPKTWEEFRKVMTAIPLSDLREEAADIAKCDGFYVEVAALCMQASGLTLTLACAALQPRVALAPPPNQPPAPQTTLPGTPPPRYANPAPTPCTQTQNKLPLESKPTEQPEQPIPDDTSHK